jgi:pimeloyl-ACP methyl ester carboxylesterase
MDTLLTILAIALAIVVGVLLIWYAISAIFMRLKRPLYSDLYLYEKDLFRKFALPDYVEPAKYERSALDVGDGVVLALYILEGPPGSPVVVFMPGTAVYAEIYSNYMFSLHQRGFTVVGYDPRGHGQAGRLRGYFNVPELLADARKVCAYAKRRFGTKIGFTGSSQGGLTGFYLAATGDPNVETVMCHNIAWCDGNTILQISSFKPPKFMVPFLVWLFRRMRKFVAPVTFYLPFNKLKLPDGKPAEPLLRADPLATLAYSLGAVASLTDTPLAVPPNQIKMPLMLLSSTEDEVFPVAYEQWLFDQLTCPKQFTLVSDQYHMMIIFSANQPWLIDPVVAWFDKYLRDPPGTAAAE